jgi:hypothetical protein
MKKLLLLICAALVFCVFFGVNKFYDVSAQSLNESAASRDAESDRQMADFLQRVTNRESGDLIPKKLRRGITELDLQGRFQNVMLSRTEPDGDLTNDCVTSLDEANAFFGKNLETGEPVQRTVIPKVNLEEIAAQYGMSVQEYLFYKNMIAQYERQSFAPQSATITIQNNDGAGEGFNDATAAPSPGEGGNAAATVGAARLAVFQQAATIWGSFLDSNITTTVSSQFDPLTCTPTGAVLGSAGTTQIFSFTSGAPYNNTLYSSALTNKIARTDAGGATAEINATFNSSLNGSAGCLGGARFYYGFDNATPSNTVNLLVVVLHELGHGFGFQSYVNGSTGALNGGLQDIFTVFMYDRTVSKYWNQMTDTERNTSKLNNGNVLWDGASVKIASGSLTAGRETSTGRVQLYTPTTFQSGSSISHFDTAVTTNVLMEPIINLGLPITLDLTRQQMRDIGWFRDTNTADTTKDAITSVVPSSGTANIGTSKTISWTNVGGFNKNVSIELSTDSGVTYPTTIASNISNTGSFSWTVPNTPTTTARVRVHEFDFADPLSASSADFSIASPTAATVAISGRVATANGRAISRAVVTLTNSNGGTRTLLTNTFGYFRFSEVEAGQIYVVSVSSKRYQFAPQILSVSEEISDLIFTADSEP